MIIDNLTTVDFQEFVTIEGSISETYEGVK